MDELADAFTPKVFIGASMLSPLSMLDPLLSPLSMLDPLLSPLSMLDPLLSPLSMLDPLLVALSMLDPLLVALSMLNPLLVALSVGKFHMTGVSTAAVVALIGTANALACAAVGVSVGEAITSTGAFA
jgi:hypothetical protein